MTGMRVCVQVSSPLVRWEGVAAAPPLDWAFTPAKFRMTCCSKASDGSDDVDFFNCAPGPEVFRRELAPY